MTKPSVAIVYHSGYGHTKKLAESVLEGVQESKKATGILISVENVDSHWDDLDHATAIIFGAPTYMGSVSAGFWIFAEKTSKRWTEMKWKDKLAAAFINSGSQNGDKLQSLHAMFNLSQQHGMIWVGLGLMPGNNSSTASIEDLNRLGSFGGAFAQSNADEGPETAPPKSDRLTAKHLGQRVAEISARWEAGKQ
ncbi:MAG: flavodoxin family protein [Alphaproteobacteria bacterium]|nr:flavodoxin family protein [Alphaproteobacteria bacterium]MBX9805917.1 flavodoxin family protein [Alphaproteobacteria bacterium]